MTILLLLLLLLIFCDSNEKVLTEREKCEIPVSISSKAHMLGQIVKNSRSSRELKEWVVQ